MVPFTQGQGSHLVCLSDPVTSGQLLPFLASVPVSSFLKFGRLEPSALRLLYRPSDSLPLHHLGSPLVNQIWVSMQIDLCCHEFIFAGELCM